MKRIALLLALCGCVKPGMKAPIEPPPFELPAFRAPAIPIMVQTPYLNVWLPADRLTDDWPKLWNGYVKGMAGMIKIDGKSFRFLGLPGSPIPVMKQDALRVFPTRTEAEFSQDDVRLKLEFISPLDPRDLRLLSLPLVIIRAEISSAVPRTVQLYLDITGEWAVGASDRRIAWDGRFRIQPAQPRFFRETNNSPDWGEVHWTAVDNPTLAQSAEQTALRQSFQHGVRIHVDTRSPRPANEDWPAFSYAWELGTVQAPVLRRAILATVRDPLINYFGTPCRPYWTRHYARAEEMIADVAANCEAIRARVRAVDYEVLTRARAAGGEELAALCALTFRQSFAANELALRGGDIFYFSKELSTGGFIQTVDLLAPAAPVLLAFNPALLRYQLEPIFEAVRRGAWHEAFAMHDLGIYPNATGQAYPKDMRVEESANLILLTAALAPYEPKFVQQSMPLLRAWADYLLDAGFAPESQLCADDFAGPQEKNANLAIKSILALATLPSHRDDALERMKRWLVEAEAGDHTAMILGDRNAWSLKYNLFFDRLLGLGLVPADIVERDVRFYRSKAGKYGTPLDSRRPHTRADWLLWIAAIAPPDGRSAILSDLLRFYKETPDRVPATDRFETDTGRNSGSMTRSVMGSVFAPILLHER